jgi:hypothetical protein
MSISQEYSKRRRSHKAIAKAVGGAAGLAIGIYGSPLLTLAAGIYKMAELGIYVGDYVEEIINGYLKDSPDEQ